MFFLFMFFLKSLPQLDTQTEMHNTAVQLTQSISYVVLHSTLQLIKMSVC